MYFVYVLLLSNRKKYIGQTNNLERRLSEHKSGKSKYTKGYKVEKLLYVEEYTTRKEAMDREKYLKSGQGREWLKQFLNSKDIGAEC